MKRRSVLTRQEIRRRKKRNYLGIFKILRVAGSGIMKVLLLTVVMTGISLMFLSAYNYLLTSPYLRLERVDVKGATPEIRRDVTRMAGLNYEESLLAINLNQLRRKLEKHPWVRSVRLERQLPHALVIEIEPQIPRAVVMMDRLYYMNTKGEVFKPVADSEKADFPVVTGVSREEQNFSEKLERANYVMNILEIEEGTWSLKALSEIHLKENEEMSLYFNHLNAEIKIKGSEAGKKMDQLKRVVKHLRQTDRIQEVTAIDLNYMDGAVVSFRKG